jgi:PAS domain-containing protein
MLLYAIGLELTIVMAFWLCLGVWQKGSSARGRLTFMGLCWAGIFWCAGELVVLRGILDEAAADRIRYVGILTLAPLWAGLAGHATRLELARRVPWFPLALMAPLACPYLLMFSERWSGLFMGTVPGQADVYGPLWWVAAAYAYVLVFAGSARFIYCAVRERTPGHWTRRLAVGIAALVPLAGNAAYLASGLSWPADPTPVLFGVALISLRSAIFTGGLLQALPVSQHELIRQLPLGVILTDRHGVVIDVNPAAERRLAVTEATAIGRTLDAILTEAGSDVRAEVSPILSQEREAGQLVLIDPPASKADTASAFNEPGESAKGRFP